MSFPQLNESSVAVIATKSPIVTTRVIGILIVPRVPDLNCPSIIVQVSKAIKSVSAEGRINVVDIKLSKSSSIQIILLIKGL